MTELPKRPDELIRERAANARRLDRPGKRSQSAVGMMAAADLIQPQIDAVLDLCDKAEANPTGWGGPMVVSFARSVREALSGYTQTAREGR